MKRSFPGFRITYLVLFVFALFASTQLEAQAPVAVREISESQWEKATKELDYSKDQPKEQKPREPRRGWSGPDWTMNTELFGRVMMIISIIVAVALIGYAIYRMMSVQRNRRIAHDGVEITIDNLDEYIHETDLDRFLKDALRQSNYSQAIRLYFLQCIKNLSNRNDIRWAREKTNREYLNEMRNNHLGSEFRELTQEYERIWYGNRPVDKARFDELQPRYEGFVKKTWVEES